MLASIRIPVAFSRNEALAIERVVRTYLRKNLSWMDYQSAVRLVNNDWWELELSAREKLTVLAYCVDALFEHRDAEPFRLRSEYLS